MRILERTSLYYLLVSVLVFVVGGTLFYLTIREEIYDEADDQLLTDKDNIIAFIQENQRLPNVTSGISEAIVVKEANPNAIVMEYLADTLVYSTYDEEYYPFRQLTFTASLDGKPYQFTLLKSLMDFDDLIGSVVLAMLWLFLLMLVGLFFVNYYVNRQVWSPFYTILHKIRDFSLETPKPLATTATNITEFRELNEVLDSMTGRIHQDYLNLKEFTENVSHEIQTPLAIVSSKLELFMQSENLTEKQSELLSDMYGAINRLSRINKSLILLTRIGNREFEEKARQPIRKLLREQVDQLQEAISMKNLHVEVSAPEEVYLQMNNGLAFILVQNLLLNAIKYNLQGGAVSVELSAARLCVRNTGEPPLGQPSQLFNRFQKGHRMMNSTGIGLALVRKICEVYGFAPTYEFEGGEHRVCIAFS